MKMTFLVALLLGILAPFHAEAADAKARFMVLGFGSESCGTYIADRNAKNDNPYRGWLTGYLTSYNEHTKNTYNVLGSSDVEAAMLWLETHCKARPLESFSEAAGALLLELAPRKQATKP